MKRITIIGSGATGTLLAVNLIKHHRNHPLEINLVEKAGRLGRGVAYSSFKNFHLLNIPANKMGAFPNDLEHFFKWLHAKNYKFFSNDFVPRKLYSEYLRDLFNETVATKTPNVAVNVFEDEAIDISDDDERTQVILSSGQTVDTDQAVLAFGNFPPPNPSSENESFIESEKYFQNPWDAETYNKIGQNDDVFIIGTGLSAVDSTLNLYYNNHKGKIYLFSTRGLLPAVHEHGFVYPSFYDELKSMTRITDLLKAVRRHIKLAEAQNSDWRAVIDSLRPHTQDIWLNLPEAEKRYFMQHLSRYWNTARHRMPPECAEILNKLQGAGRVEILKGRLKNIEPADGKINIAFSTMGEENKLALDAVINCIGSQSNYALIDSPLVKNLIDKGLVEPDSLKMGINALPDGRTINKTGSVSNKIFVIGTALKGVLWESIAIPEIREQANKLALSLLNGDQRQ